MASEEVEPRVHRDLKAENGVSALTQKRNGFYVFENALHVFSMSERETINRVIDEVDGYKKENCKYFAEDIFGNLFCEQNEKIYLLDLESGIYEHIANSTEEWAQRILEDHNYLTGYPLAKLWQEKVRKLENGERLVPKIFFVLGGDYSVENLYALNGIRALQLRIDLYNQIKDIQDGEKVEIKIKKSY
jgi:hypothetical protein